MSTAPGIGDGARSLNVGLWGCGSLAAPSSPCITYAHPLQGPRKFPPSDQDRESWPEFCLFPGVAHPVAQGLLGPLPQGRRGDGKGYPPPPWSLLMGGCHAPWCHSGLHAKDISCHFILMLAASPEAGGGREPTFRCRAACQPLTPRGDPLAGLPGQLERPPQHEGQLGCPPGLSSGSQKSQLCSHRLPLSRRQGTVLGSMGALIPDAGSCCKCSFVHPS